MYIFREYRVRIDSLFRSPKHKFMRLMSLAFFSNTNFGLNLFLLLVHATNPFCITISLLLPVSGVPLGL